MELNILKIVLDRSGQIAETQNLSLYQCSDNNRIKVYYEGILSLVEMSFRKPDGKVSDRVKLIFDVDEDGAKYAYYDIDPNITSFIMGGRSAILVGNLYIYGEKDDRNQLKQAALGNIRINVNYVDDAYVDTTGISQAGITSMSSSISALENKINDFKVGGEISARATADANGKVIHKYYETKADSLDKYFELKDSKVDKGDITDQTNRLTALETNASLTKNLIDDIETDISTNESNISKNAEDIKELEGSTVKYDEYTQHLINQQKKDEELYEAIVRVSNSSNFYDMVKDRNALRTYDKSKLIGGERIQVLVDGEYGDVPSVWKYNAETKDFDFVGIIANTSYTKAESKKNYSDIEAKIPNKIVAANDSISLYRDTTQIDGQTPVRFKTVSGQSIFGSGDIPATVVDSKIDGNSTNPVQNKVIAARLAEKADKSTVNDALNAKADKTELTLKQDKLTAGANIKIENGKISADIGLSIEKFDSLPPIGVSNIIYLIPNNTGTFDEYVWLVKENKYERLGDTGININDYYNISEIDTKLSGKTDVSVSENLEKLIAANTVSISGKADRNSVNDLTSSVEIINTVLSGKVNNTDFETYKNDTQTKLDYKQTKLVSGENIKRIEDGERPYEEGLDDEGNPIKVYGEKKTLDILGSGNISVKTINGKSLLGEGEILLADADVVDLENYITKEKLNDSLALKADKTDLQNLEIDYTTLKNKPDLEQIQLQLKSEIKQDITSATNLLNDNINDLSGSVYSKEETYNKEEIENKIQEADISEKLNDYYTKEEVDTAIQEHVPELEGYATETWVEGKNYLTKSEAVSTYVSYTTLPQGELATTKYVDERVAAVDVSSQLTEYAKTEYVDKKVSDLIDSAPETLDTLSEIAVALKNNSDTMDVLNSAIGTKQDKLTAGTNIEINGNTISAVIDISADNIPGLNLSDYAKKTYVDNMVKAEVSSIVGAAPKELDTLFELSEAIKDNSGTIQELETIATNKQDKLVSGTNIKTINNQSILGSGNIKVAGSFNDLTDKDSVIVSANVADNTLTLRNAANETITFKGTTDYTKLTNTPTKLSQFTNDKKYATTDEVSTTVSTEIAKVVAGADAKYDTLKEIADYIASDKTNAATLTATVEANKTNILMMKEDATALETRVETNETDIAALKNADTLVSEAISDITEIIGEHTTDISSLENNVEILKAFDHNAMLSDISTLKNTTSVHTGNISDINTRISDINTKNSEQDTALAEIQQTIGDFNGSLSDFYTKAESDDKFLVYDGTIMKSESVVDYTNPSKAIRFTTDVEIPDFTITQTEFTDISNLLAMMVPNEY